MATKRKRPARAKARQKSERVIRTDVSKAGVHPIDAACDRAAFETFVKRDWLGAFAAWVFNDLSLPTAGV